MRAKKTLEDLQMLAAQKGGRCLSPAALGNREKHLWECLQGHQWETTPNVIVQGSWCPRCQKHPPLTLEYLQRLAESRGGTCLSPAALGAHTPYRWRCEFQHEWSATPSRIRRGAWCPACAGKGPLPLKELKGMARVWGGRFLEDAPQSNIKGARWSCALGHTWKARPADVRRGIWCPTCARSAPPTLRELQAIAAARGGACLSDNATGIHARHTWQCRLGHTWSARVLDVRLGAWCPTCNPEVPLARTQAAAAPVPRKSKLAQKRKKPPTKWDLLDLARAKGGTWQGELPPSWSTPTFWRCAKGHTWSAKATSIRTGAWCPSCAGVRRLTLEDLQATAAAKGGSCLSSSYDGTSARYLWKCEQGHEWMATASAVRGGGWCPRCRRSHPLTLEDLRASAAAHGGTCLAEDCRGAGVKYRWRCGKGHEWDEYAFRVRAGTWCPICRKAQQA